MTPLHQAFLTLLNEIFYGTVGAKGAYMLNPNDPGMLAQLESLDAHTASKRPMPGHTTIAAHTDHVWYGLSLLNRAMSGEEDVFQKADWNASWKRTHVDDAEWKTLLKKFREESDAWKTRMQSTTDFGDEISTAGCLASFAHAAYHLGAIRQLLAAQGKNNAPG